MERIDKIRLDAFLQKQTCCVCKYRHKLNFGEYHKTAYCSKAGRSVKFKTLKLRSKNVVKRI